MPVLNYQVKLPGDLGTPFALTFNHGKWDLNRNNLFRNKVFRKKLEAKECEFATINSTSRDKNSS